MEDFVTLEIAKKLKEKRFPQGNENDITEKYYTISDSLKSAIMLANNEDVEWYCPTISQVLNWLREEHHLHFEIVGAAYGYNLIISDTPDKGGTDRYYSHLNDDGPNYAGAWDDYDGCVLYGIEYVLDNLI